ncbi:MAG TPA: hypothetical protein H9740_05745 [Candidatus Hungatella pullicola]|nr:hypothetical protein [Candidatus Hungatella pullicola]
MIGAVVFVQVQLFACERKIRNPLGHLVALSSACMLFGETLFYILGNLGFQFGSFPTLPFIPEGLASITANMTLAGLILSAYSYDQVIDGDWEEQKKIKIGYGKRWQPEFGRK